MTLSKNAHKNVSSRLLLLIVILSIGLGGCSKSKPISNTPILSDDDLNAPNIFGKVDTIYDLDGTAFLSLDIDKVIYDHFTQTSIDDLSKENAEVSLKLLVASSLKSVAFPQSDYYPQGLAGMFKVPVLNGKIEFEYKLPGDIDGDFIVDENDINAVIDAIIEQDKKTDLNEDGLCNWLDLTYAIARIGTEAISYSIYDDTGTCIKASVPIAQKNSNVLENETDIDSVHILIADGNGAHQKKVTLKKSVLTAQPQLDNYISATLNAQFSKTPPKYLVGWQFWMTLSGMQSDYLNSKYALKSTFENQVVKKHFNEADMNVPYVSSDAFHSVGKTTGDLLNFNTDENALVDLDITQDYNFKVPRLIDGTGVSKSLIIWSNRIYHSAASKFQRKIDIEGWGSVNGDVVLKRIGPGKDHNDFEITLNASDSNVSGSFPYGEYQATFNRKDVGISIDLGDTIVHDGADKTPLNFKGRQSLEGYVFNGSPSNHTPAEDITMTIVPLIEDAEIIVPNPVITDSGGYYRFDDLPIGLYALYANGVEKLQVLLNGKNGATIMADNIYLNSTYQIEVLLEEYGATLQMIWNEVLIDNASNHSEGLSKSLSNSVYIASDEADLEPDEINVLATYEDFDQLTPEFWGASMTLYRTDALAVAPLKPNTYYLEFWLNTDWYYGDALVIQTGSGSFFPPYDAHLTSELDASKMKQLIDDGTPFNWEHNLEGFIDFKGFKVTITPNQ